MPPKVSEMCEYIHSISDFGTDSDYLRDVQAKWVSRRTLSLSTFFFISCRTGPFSLAPFSLSFSIYTTNDLLPLCQITIHFSVGVKYTNKFNRWPGLFPGSDGHHHTKKPLLWRKMGTMFSGWTVNRSVYLCICVVTQMGPEGWTHFFHLQP